MIYIAGISIALFISALLLAKRGKSKSDLFLFLWMVLMALHLFLYYANFNQSIYQWPHLLGLELPMPILHGVFLYYYVASVTNQFPKKKWIVLLHLIPISVLYVYLVSFFFLEPTAHKIEVYRNTGAPYHVFNTINTVLIYLSGTIYVIWSSILLGKHKKNIRDQFSDIEKINLKWLQFLTYGLGVIWAVVIVTNSNIYIFTAVSIFVILIGFFGVQQKDVFSKQNVVLEKPSDVKSQKGKYAKSGLTKGLADDAYNNLMHLITHESYYKKYALSLNELASELNIHPNYLSQIINEREGKNFYDFVNAFRVEEFKRLIKIPDNQQFTLLALAYDCGFNSKSSFNRSFKKNTGSTPSQYFKLVTEQQ